MHSLEPIDNNEINSNVTRTKLHRFIRIHDDLEILNEHLSHINDHSLSSSSNDLTLIFDCLNSIKRTTRIYLDQLEKLLAKNRINENYRLSNVSPLRT